jgi:hypothetical protein
MPVILPAPYAGHQTQAWFPGWRPASANGVYRRLDWPPDRYPELGIQDMIKSVLNRRLNQIVAAAVIGAVVGFVVFTVSQVTGRNLYIIIGGVAGAAAVLVLQQFWRTAQLTEVKVIVPQVSELTFVVNNDARQVAWKLYVEAVTRTSTQPLADEDGFIREALTSLYGLFSTTRDTLKASRPSVPVSGRPTVEYLAVTMLNLQLRPFLSKWHPRLRQFENAHPDEPESAWPGNEACRAELRLVQANLVGYALGFADLAGVREAKATMASSNQPTT